MKNKTITILSEAEEENPIPFIIAQHNKTVNGLCTVIGVLILAVVLLMFRTGC